MLKKFVCAASLCAVVCASSNAAEPRLKTIEPRGGQRGTAVTMTFRGDRLGDAQEIFCYEPGLEITKVEPAKDGKSVVVTANIAADCMMGEHTVQVRCASGISDFHTFYVGVLPDIAEAEPNNDFSAPQPVPLNVTISGVSDNEDVDYYVIEAHAGQRICVEIEGLRLGADTNPVYDPAVAILNADRFELAVADDTPLLSQDAVASIVAPADGRYVVMVRDSAYRGNGNCKYRLHVGEFPRPLAVYPAGGPAGQETTVTYIGDPAGSFTEQVQAPAEPTADFPLFAQQNGQRAPSANHFRVSPFPNVLEQEPNGNVGEATVAAAAVPVALNGVLSETKDTDFLKFSATKGQNLRIECYARRLRTPVDPVLSVHNAKGGQLAANDDNGGPDAGLDFNVPEDGEYFVAVRDFLWRSGPEFVYRVEIAPQQPDLTLSIPRVTRYEQVRQQIVVPQGGRYASLINATRRNFGGEIVLEADALPAGVTMTAVPMAGNLNSTPVLFTAAADAPLGGTLSDLKGYKKDGPREEWGRFANTADIVREGNQGNLWEVTTTRMPVAVVEKLPFSIEIVEPKVPLVRSGTLNLKVIATRDEGFTKPIRIEFPFRPPGVGALPNIDIPEGQTEGSYTLNGEGNAQIGTMQVVALGLSDIGGTGVCGSPLINLSVAETPFTLAMERAAVEQGQPVEVFAKVEIKEPFEGTATATLMGLPDKVTAEPVQITKDTTEVRFKVQTTAESREGRHQNLFVQAVIPRDGEEINFRAGTVELRVDKPRPKPAPPAEKPPEEKKPEEPKPAEPAPAKPLSRLEQLRLEAKQAAEAGM